MFHKNSALALFLFTGFTLMCLARKRPEINRGDDSGNDKHLSATYDNTRLTVVTRVHGVSATTLASHSSIIAFIRSCESFASTIVVCIGVGDAIEHAEYLSELRIAISKEPFKKSLDVVLLPVTPWGKFTGALNSALLKVSEKGDAYIAFQSLEFRIDLPVVTSLLSYMNQHQSTLVIGPRMNGHEFQSTSSEVVLRGRTCPWNTFAIWRTRYLAMTGFPMVADGMSSNMGGVEEVVAITLLQKLFPKVTAVLAKIAGVSWETNFSDPKRMQWHEEKMRSKDERPAMQLQWLGLQGGRVLHVDLERI